MESRFCGDDRGGFFTFLSVVEPNTFPASFAQSWPRLLTTVPYKGTAPAMNDLLGGQVDMLCDQTTNTSAYIKSDRATAEALRSHLKSEVGIWAPIIRKAGVYAD